MTRIKRTTEIARITDEAIEQLLKLDDPHCALADAIRRIAIAIGRMKPRD